MAGQEQQDGTDKDSQKTPLPPSNQQAAVAPSTSLKNEGALWQTPPAPDQSDPNAVGWDGDNDRSNPMNWPAKKKWLNLGALSVMTFLT